MFDREKSAPVKAGGAARLWKKSFLTGSALFFLSWIWFFVRQYFKDGSWAFDPTLINKSLAVTSLLLISFSMLLTGLAMLRRRYMKYLPWRRFLGITGFVFGMAHALVGHAVFPLIGIEMEESGGLAILSDVLGYLSLAIFGLMAVASFAKVKGFIGGAMWRYFLRFSGYTALILVVVHSALLKWDSWLKYVNTFGSVLPSLSLPAVLVGIAALVFRLMGEKRKSRRRPAGVTST